MARTTAACSTASRTDDYERRRPEESLLYEVIEQYWPIFLERAEQNGGLPDFITDEFEAYLRCGILEYGLVHLSCKRCGESTVVGVLLQKQGILSLVHGSAHVRPRRSSRG